MKAAGPVLAVFSLGTLAFAQRAKASSFDFSQDEALSVVEGLRSERLPRSARLYMYSGATVPARRLYVPRKSQPSHPLPSGDVEKETF